MKVLGAKQKLADFRKERVYFVERVFAEANGYQKWVADVANENALEELRAKRKFMGSNLLDIRRLRLRGYRHQQHPKGEFRSWWRGTD